MLAKILSNEKLIESKTSNRLGLQVGRALAARLALKIRRAQGLSPPNGVAQWADELKAEGYCVVQNFLSPDVFDTVRAEFAGATSDEQAEGAKLYVDGYNLGMLAVPINSRTRDSYPATSEHLMGDRRWKEIFCAHEGARLEQFENLDRLEARFERIKQHEGQPPPNKDFSTCILHADTFHTVTKAFFYLEATNERNGAFVFAPRSHRLNLRRLRFEYANSVGRFDRSPQPTDAELAEIGVEKRSICCPANTLMIVNPQGFHARGFVDPGFERHAIYWEFRSSPFRP